MNITKTVNGKKETILLTDQEMYEIYREKQICNYVDFIKDVYSAYSLPESKLREIAEFALDRFWGDYDAVGDLERQAIDEAFEHYGIDPDDFPEEEVL